MSVNPEKFSLLLHEGVTAIQKSESREKKKTRRQIYEELGKGIGRKASSIEYFLQNHVPISSEQITNLARMIFLRGNMDEKWLRDLLTASGHPKVRELVEQLTTVTPEIYIDNSKYQCKRLLLDYNLTLHPDRNTTAIIRVEMQSTSLYEIPSLRHQSYRTNHKSEIPRKLMFLPISRSGIGVIKHHIFTNVPDFLHWNVVFDPPLQPAETASYEYHIEMEDVHPWTVEECQSFVRQGLISHMCCAADFYVSFPTDVLNMSVVLPVNYDLVLPGSGGFRSTEESSEDLTEKTRMAKMKSFQAQQNALNNQWTLSLSVSNPKVAHTYYVEWIPPSERILMH